MERASSRPVSVNRAGRDSGSYVVASETEVLINQPIWERSAPGRDSMERLRMPRLLASGVDPVKGAQIQLSYLSGNDTYYWDANITQFSSFTVTANTAWFIAGNSWFYVPSINWPTDMSHLITLQTRGNDLATLADGTGGGNVSVPQSVSFNIDFFVTSLRHDYLSERQSSRLQRRRSRMTGSQSDDLAGVNLIQVEISTGLGGSKNYWTGSAWTTSQTWITTTTANPWNYTIPTTALASGLPLLPAPAAHRRRRQYLYEPKLHLHLRHPGPQCPRFLHRWPAVSIPPFLSRLPLRAPPPTRVLMPQAFLLSHSHSRI